MRKVILVLWGLVGAWGLGHAQTGQIDTCLQEVMDHYVDYVNDNISTLEQYLGYLEKFNRDLNLYHESSPSVRKTLTLKFPRIEIRDNSANYSGLTPSQRYDLLIEKEACLPAENRTEIGKNLRQMEEVMEEIVSIGGALFAYVGMETYRKETDQASAYQLISRAFVLFHDFSALKDALHYELIKLYRAYEEPDSQNPYARSTRALMAVIVPARDILKSLKEKNPSQVRSNLLRMRAAIDRAKRNAIQNLATIRRQGSRDEPSVWYHYVLAVAEDFRAAALEYLETDFFPRKYEKQGKEYYYYNLRLLPIYNATGEGMIQRYNWLVEASDLPLLKMVEEPAWLMMAFPDEPAQDPPDLVVEEPESDSGKNAPEVEVARVLEMQIDTLEEEPRVPVAASPQPAPSLKGAAPNNLVLLLDVSSSMEGEGKLPLLKESFKKLLALMRPQDRVAIVVYSGEARVVLPSTSSQERARIISVLESLTSEGKTDALEGVVLAYRVAQHAFIPEGNNRIILASDGYFPIPEALPRLVKDKAAQHIQMSVFFFGESDDRITERLVRLAALGEGNYRHIQPENAEIMLIEEANAVREK